MKPVNPLVLLLVVRLAAFTIGSAQQPAADSNPASKIQADQIIVTKSQRTLVLMKKGKVLKTCTISLGGEPIGPKTREGDHKTPEGFYVIDSRNPQSRFHLALHVSYPNASDIANAKKHKVSPGGDIMIHGLPKGYGWVKSASKVGDWTDGCIAVTNEEIEEIWRMVPDGTPIEIKR
jgi:murein L,D-transpeptidase YafK